jgi:hypothetical protein
MAQMALLSEPCREEPDGHDVSSPTRRREVPLIGEVAEITGKPVAAQHHDGGIGTAEPAKCLQISLVSANCVM